LEKQLIAETILEQVRKLRDALSGHASGVADEEGRTALHKLLPEVAHRETDDAWSAAVCTLVWEQEDRSDSWWRGLELLVSLSDLHTHELRQALEALLKEKRVSSPLARASIYGMLSECAEPIDARTLFNDLMLKKARPLLWLDLILPLLPDTETQQRLVLEAVLQRNLKVDDVEDRLTEIRRAGGKEVGWWLGKLRDAFPIQERPIFDNVLRAASLNVTSPPIRSPGRYEAIRADVSTFGEYVKSTSEDFRKVAA
jgi:hypothetical protein